MTFEVRDRKTGEWADTEEIARTESWAKDLMSMDMQGFAIGDEDDLYLMDECGHYVSCPDGRFEIVLLRPDGA